MITEPTIRTLLGKRVASSDYVPRADPNMHPVQPRPPLGTPGVLGVLLAPATTFRGNALVVGYNKDSLEWNLITAWKSDAGWKDTDPIMMPHLHLPVPASWTLWYHRLWRTYLESEQDSVPSTAKRVIPKHPHQCPKCRSAALILFNSIECSNFACTNWRARA